MNPCFALLDDASAADPAEVRSRLYTGHAGTLACHDGASWPRLLDQMQQALQRGLHAVCMLSYELGGHLLGLECGASAGPALAQVLLFEHCQHLTQPDVSIWLAAQAPVGATPAGIARVRANVDQAEFDRALARIHRYLEAGDTYQVNYTYRLHFDTFGCVFALYARLRARQPVPYGALVLQDDGTALLSLSPELFVRHAQRELVACPMKGTAPAAAPEQVAENERRADALAADPKNRAENLMIVDLLRNDLGRIAEIGSVSVPALFQVQRYGSVLQMTSTVRATLRPDARLADIFQALYPCGSITGAPKRRSMEIIAELEPAPRGIYTGAIGWFDPVGAGAGAGAGAAVGDFCLSVPIRTLALAAPTGGVRKGVMGVGAGIVFDSDAADEYAECRLKAHFLTGLGHEFELFETIYATRTDGCRHLERHLARLAGSARYFGFSYDELALHSALHTACAGLGTGAHRLRLALDHAGAYTMSSAPLAELTQPVGLLMAVAPTRADAVFLRHKTTVRERYDQGWREAEAQGAFDTLFWNQRGELTEGGRSNVFVKFDGRWYTPPLSCGVLPGVMRAILLADPAWGARERVLTPSMLDDAQEIVVCNALRGPLTAVLRT